MAKFATKLKPQPLKPETNGLKSMTAAIDPLHQAQLDELKARHKREELQLRVRQTKEKTTLTKQRTRSK